MIASVQHSDKLRYNIQNLEARLFSINSIIFTIISYIMNNDLFNLQIECIADFAEKLSDKLFELNAYSVTIEDLQRDKANEIPLFVQEIKDSIELWDNCKITALFSSKYSINDLVTKLNNTFPKANLIINAKFLEDKDWVAEGKNNFKQLKVSERLWIVPSWSENQTPGKINIYLDPGMAFGTGTHPTTYMCLKWLSDNLTSSAKILDYGTGSGILAIAALKLGASACDCLDIDQLALNSAAENALKNNVTLNFYKDDQPISNNTYDLVVANILANPLKELAARLTSYLKKDKTIILSGILESQKDEIIKIYKQWFHISEIKQLNGWVCIVGTKTI